MKIKQFLTFHGVCPVCHSKEFRLSEKNAKKHSSNFYIEAIVENLVIDRDDLDKEVKVYSCDSCGTIFCDPWFNSQTSFNIFNVIYGQHNRGWNALNGWIKQEPIQNYWEIIEFSQEKIGRNIDSYAEYHCPFQGNFFKFRDQELPANILPDYFDSCRQFLMASNPDKDFGSDIKKKSQHIINERRAAREKLTVLNQEQNLISTKRFLALETSTRFWDASCISECVNCKSLAAPLLNIDVLPFEDFNRQQQKIDVFAFINTLDHSHDPMKLIYQALEFSELVFIINHAQDIITKQHKFLFQKKFINFLERQDGLHVEDLTQQHSFISDEVNKDKIALVLKKYK